jgi:O-acetyl-ADP-ribose deacetylase (regulator of RNase III)
MPIEHRIGNLFDSKDLDALAHGTNTLGVMGAGIAVEFKRRYPEMYRLYNKLGLQGSLEVGFVMPWYVQPPAIFNLMTQGHKGRTILPATLKAIKESVEEMFIHAENTRIKRIGIPKIGAGLGGLDWNDVEKVLLECLEAHPDITLVVHSLA